MLLESLVWRRNELPLGEFSSTPFSFWRRNVSERPCVYSPQPWPMVDGSYFYTYEETYEVLETAPVAGESGEDSGS